MLGTLKNSLIRTQIVLEIDNKKCLESPHMFRIFQNSVNVKTRSQKVLYLYIKMCLVLGSVKIIRQGFSSTEASSWDDLQKSQGTWDNFFISRRG